MPDCWDLWQIDCKRLPQEATPLERWVQGKVQSLLHATGSAFLPDIIALGTLGVAACFLAMMVFGNPGRWLRRAGVIFAFTVLCLWWLA